MKSLIKIASSTIPLFLFVTLISSCSNKLAVSVTTKSNCIIYFGVENPIQITSSKKNVNVSLSNGTIKKVDASNYMVQVYDSNFTYVLLKHKSRVDSVKLRCRKIPDPVMFLVVGNKTWFEREIPDSVFRDFKYLTGAFYSFEDYAQFSIDSYKLIRITPDGKRIEGFAYLAKDAKAGDIIIVKDIMITMMNKEKRKLDDKVYWIR